MTGGWNIDVNKGTLPEKVATGFVEVFADMDGATYEPLIYVGSQVVNGINHAIVAKQTLVTNPPVDAIVLIILNEKPIDPIKSKFSVVSIEPIVKEHGGPGTLGDLEVNVQDITPETRKIFNEALEGLIGATYKPLYLVATQVVHGTNFVFLAQQNLATLDNDEHLVEVVVNVDEEEKARLVSIKTIL
jgi:hypothetical protein